MLLFEAELHEPATLQETWQLMERFGAEGRLLAGGTDVLIDVKRERFKSSHLVSINRISSLRGVAPEDGGVRIGALTTVNQLATSAIIVERYPAILDAALKMAGPQIRNMATVGGNLCNANHCADLPPILMVMNATVTLRAATGHRVLPIEEFFVGPKKTALRAGEVLTDIFIPYPPARFGAAFARFSLREANAIAVTGVAAALIFGEDGKIRAARIGLSAAVPTPTLCKAAAALLVGGPLDDESIDGAAVAALKAASNLISDIRAQGEFRQSLVGTLTRDALVTAGARAATTMRGSI